MQIILSSTSAVPIYEQIKTQIRHAIHSGDIAEGARLPSLRQLAAELRVSVITVTRAYNDLVAEQLVSNEHGRGFVVRPVDSTVAGAALAERFDRAVVELVAAGRSAHLNIDDINREVEAEWKRR
ncbi:transcriptional regulator, GntR family [Microlunatus soli]|uniref:Transcriptional regulator, GntR family n=1 Tax=Microlunatus soli TaxID=630515 RepID=A0A1H1U3G1_9ACTN|nr:transcriptional regulator, GntR family [Microlunatus soli]